MPWVKKDDRMPEHPKTRLLIRKRKWVGLAAYGLHDLAMGYASANLTDGHVPVDLVEDWCERAGLRPRDQDAIVTALVGAGQWRVDVENGGWIIHDFLDYNPSRVKVLADRERDAKRKARGRDTDSGRIPPGHDSGSARNPSGVRASRPDPSRPDHNKSGPTSNVVGLPRNVGPSVSGDGEWAVAP